MEVILREADIEAQRLREEQRAAEQQQRDERWQRNVDAAWKDGRNAGIGYTLLAEFLLLVGFCWLTHKEPVPVPAATSPAPGPAPDTHMAPVAPEPGSPSVVPTNILPYERR